MFQYVSLDEYALVAEYLDLSQGYLNPSRLLSICRFKSVARVAAYSH